MRQPPFVKFAHAKFAIAKVAIAKFANAKIVLNVTKLI